MTTSAYVALTSQGTPVATSTGVPILSPSGRLRGLGVRVRTPYHGGIEAEIGGLGFGPGVPGWAQRKLIPPHKAHPDALATLDKMLPVPFAKTTGNVFWRECLAEFGTHVILDESTLELKIVRAVAADLCFGFWSGIVAAFAEPEDAEDAESWGSAMEAWDDAGLFGTQVYACLDPAPHLPGAAVAWSWRGQPYVIFDLSVSRPEEEAVLFRESRGGLALA